MSSGNDDEFPIRSSSVAMTSSSKTIIYPPSYPRSHELPSSSSSMINNISPSIIVTRRESLTASSISPSPDTHTLGSAMHIRSAADSLSLSEPNSFGAYIETYSNLLSVFSFEKAKELAEKQSWQQKVSEPLWSSLALLMSQIAMLEKQYMNLSFLAPKGFLRKDSNLKTQFEHTKQDLNKLVSNSDYVFFTKDLLFLIAFRLDLIEFYEKLSLLGSAKNVEIGDVLSDIEIICEKYSDEMKSVGSVRTGSLFQSLGWEIELILNLLKCHSCTQNWDFFGAIIAIQIAQTQLTEWSDFLQAKQSSKKSAFIKSSSTPPYLYNWLLKVKAAFLSKLSLYFNEILAKYSNPSFDIRVISAKLQVDYYLKISSFQKRTDAMCCCLVFDARDIKFNPNGYEYPSHTQAAPPTGIETFPAVLSIPAKPANYWPSVVMLISDRMRELVADKIVGFFDQRIQATFFLARVDPRVFFLIIYENKKSEKDSYVVKFIQEIVTDLKCGKVFSSLKLGAK